MRFGIQAQMFLGLLAVFTVLGDLFALGAGNIQTKLVMVTLLLMTPTVYLVILRTFDSVEKAYKAVKRKLKREKL